MRKILITILVMTLVGILAGGTCIAGVPESISYQGKLTNSEGQPVSDDVYQVVFKLYTAATEEKPFWTSKQEVTTSGGVFTTQLSPLAAYDLAGKTDVWMEIWVGSPLAALSPKTKFTSVPYALISGDSWSLLGNAGTTPGTNFIGTTDNQALEFRVNNTRGFRLEPYNGTVNVIGGYSGNTVASGVYGATISGGGVIDYPNSVTNHYGTVGGGGYNTASGYYGTIGGGYHNAASNQYATVGGGAYNTTSGFVATIGGGENNTASNYNATVAGGETNTASGSCTTIGGGDSNTASGSYATIGGGNLNTASGVYSTVPGGVSNTAFGVYSFAAGQRAKANHQGAFVWADSTAADFASTGNNQFLIRASGGVGIGINNPAAALDVNGLIRSRTGGFKFPDDTIQTTAAWGLTGNAGTTPGTNFIGTTDNMALEFKVNNTRGFRLEPYNDTVNVIGGYSGNTVASGVYGATISGGGYGDCPNSVTNHYGAVGGGYYNTSGWCATVGGGDYNTASGYAGTVGGGFDNTAYTEYSTVGGGHTNAASGLYATVGGGDYNFAIGTKATVGGGFDNTASGDIATVGGGYHNTASGLYATVPGGYYNTAYGLYATVPGGYYNTASGTSSFAAGRQAKASHNGAFVWADSTVADFASTAANQFLIRASGNVGINTTSPSYTLHVNGSVAGIGAYNALSDLRYKTNIATIGNALDKVMKLRGINFDWKKSDYPEIAFGDGRQIGFVAQEIAQVMPEVVSKDSKGIYSVAYGSVVPLLVEAMKEQEKKIESQQQQIDDLKKLVAELVSKEKEKP